MKTATMSKLVQMAAALLMVGLVGCEGEFDEAASAGAPLVLQTPSAWSDWSEPVPVEELNTGFIDSSPALSNDGLSVYFQSNRTGTLGGTDLMVSHRATKSDPWEQPQYLGSVVNSTANDNAPTLSKDGLVMVFLSNRTGGSGGNDLYVTRRTDPTDDFSWGAPENLGADVNTSGDENQPYLQKQGEDGNPTLYFNRGTDIYAAPVDKDGATLGTAVTLAELNSDAGDAGVTVSKDGLELIFHSDRAGSVGSTDLWVSTRASVHDAWSAPQHLGAVVNSSLGEIGAALSSDGRTLLFTAAPGASGTMDIMMSTRTPVGGNEDE